MNFNSLINNSKTFSQIADATTSKNVGTTFTKDPIDPRFWTCSVDAETNSGYAIIHFLYLKEWWDSNGEICDIPWVSWYEHSFKGYNKRMYIERSLSSINEEDPLFSLNKKLWDTGEQRWRDFVSYNTKRKIAYVAPIVVIDDPIHPEFNGKVKLFKFGVQIFRKFDKALNPTIKIHKAIDPFSIGSNGANFNLIVAPKTDSSKKDAFRSYEESAFDSPGKLYNGDEQLIMEVYNQVFSKTDMDNLVSKDKFKTYEELKKNLDFVLNCNSDDYLDLQLNKTRNLADSVSYPPNSGITKDARVAGPSPVGAVPTTLSSGGYAEENEDDDVETSEKLSFFQSLINK
jgi:hypothetical protein